MHTLQSTNESQGRPSDLDRDLYSKNCYFGLLSPGEQFHKTRLNDRGYIVFVLSVCFSVCLLSTLTFAITFEPYEKETSYLACILHQ